MWRFRYVSSYIQNICHEVEGVFSELWECSKQKGDFSHAYYDQEKQHAPCVVLHSRLIMILYNLKSMNMVVGNQLTVSLRLIKPFDYFRIDLTATLSFRSSLY